MIAALPTLIQDTVDAWPLILGFIGLFGWGTRRFARWIRAEVAAQLQPLGNKIDQINTAVNNVDPGTPALKDRVGSLERNTEEIHGQLTIIRDMLRELVGR